MLFPLSVGSESTLAHKDEQAGLMNVRHKEVLLMLLLLLLLLVVQLANLMGLLIVSSRWMRIQLQL